MSKLRRKGLTQVKKLLWAAMETQGPNFVYQPAGSHSPYGGGGCYNIPVPPSLWTTFMVDHKKHTGCLIGVMLANMGVKFTEENAYSGVQAFSYLFTPKALEYLKAAQVRQDLGASWGEAIEYANSTDRPSYVPGDEWAT